MDKEPTILNCPLCDMSMGQWNLKQHINFMHWKETWAIIGDGTEFWTDENKRRRQCPYCQIKDRPFNIREHILYRWHWDVVWDALQVARYPNQ